MLRNLYAIFHYILMQYSPKSNHGNLLILDIPRNNYVDYYRLKFHVSIINHVLTTAIVKNEYH